MQSYSNTLLNLLNTPTVVIESFQPDVDLYEILESEGLVDNINSRYSIIEIIWMDILERCHSFGFKAKEIKTLYEGLFYKADDKSISSLERVALHTLQQGTPTFLVVSEGIQEFWLLDVLCYTDYLGSGALKDHLLIPINKLIQELLPNITSPTLDNKETGVRDLVFQIIRRLHNPGCKSIKLIKKQGKPHLIEEVERLSSETTISALLGENSYQDINIKTSGGKVAYIERTIRQKIQKDETHP